MEVSKETIYIVPESTKKSRRITAPEPVLGHIIHNIIIKLAGNSV